MMKKLLLGLLGLGAMATVVAETQFVGLPSYRVGAYGANGTTLYGGMIDYFSYINEKGGINGVKLSWEECETEYNNAKGVECYERLKTKSPTGNTAVHPLSTGITYALLDRVVADKTPMVTVGYGRTDASDGRVFPWVFPLVSNYWNAASGIVKFLSDKEKGNLKGKKIVLLYHDSAYGKEPHAVLAAEAERYGFELKLIPVAHPGNEQQAQWLQIRQYQPNWVILWGWGVMNATAIKTAEKVGYPRNKMVGNWWAGAENDVIPAGPGATGYYAASMNVAGRNYPIVRDIENTVYAKGKGNLSDKSQIGTVLWNRGLMLAMLTVEGVKKAQERYGNKPMTGEQVRWGLENLNVNQAALDKLGFSSMMPPVKTSCADHEGSGLVRFQQWNGKEWQSVTPWMSGDRAMVRKLIEESAAKYAKEKNITPGCLG